MSETIDKLKLEPRQQLSATAGTIEVGDFDGDVLIVTPSLGQHLASADLGRLFLVAAAAAGGLVAGAVIALGLVGLGKDLGRLVFGWIF